MSLVQDAHAVQFGRWSSAWPVATAPVHPLAVVAQRLLVAGLSEGAAR